MKAVVCDADSLGPGQIRSAKLGKMPIAVIRTPDGELHGLFDRCLHMGASLARGRLLTAQTGQQCGEYVEIDGRYVVKCPWHGYEYDVRSGATMFDERVRVATVTVREEGGQIVAESAP